MTPPAPTAFISYTRPDSAFCHALYDALLSRGIRPLLDERDFLLGDDLPQAIFDRGIGAADAALIVLSPDSTASVYQQAEVSATTVRAITEKVRIISIILRDLPDEQIPLYLRTKIYLRITGTMSVDAAADRIAQAIHGDRPNPTIAPPPAWTQIAVGNLYGLNAIDEIAFVQMCEQQIASNNPIVSIEPIFRYAEQAGISLDDFEAGLGMLQRNYYIEKAYAEGGTRLPIAVRISRHGMDRYLSAYRAEQYAHAFRDVVAAIANRDISDIHRLRASVDAPPAILEHILETLDYEGEIHLIRSCGDDLVWRIEPTLRRRLD